MANPIFNTILLNKQKLIQKDIFLMIKKYILK